MKESKYFYEEYYNRFRYLLDNTKSFTVDGELKEMLLMILLDYYSMHQEIIRLQYKLFKIDDIVGDDKE